jgi:hypothetical protein
MATGYEPARMDDCHAQFLMLLESVCAGAELADLRIELQTNQGARIGGVPRNGSPAGGFDQTDYDNGTVRVGTVEVTLRDVVNFTVAAPDGLRPLSPV